MNFNGLISFLINFPIYFFWFIIVLIPLVVAHEFGHLLIAKIFGVKVPEFGVGVPPKITGKRWKCILWSLNWIPLGAFVRIVGDNDAIENAYRISKTDKVSAKDYYRQARLEEVFIVDDLFTILDKNHIEFSKEWQAYPKTYKKNPELVLAQTKQLETLIDWEYDAYLVNKNKKEFNSLFFTKPLYAKILILLGGVTANFMMACFLFFIALNTTGLQVTNVSKLNSTELVAGKQIATGSLTKKGLMFLDYSDNGKIVEYSKEAKTKFNSLESNSAFDNGQAIKYVKTISYFDPISNLAVDFDPSSASNKAYYEFLDTAEKAKVGLFTITLENGTVQALKAEEIKYTLLISMANYKSQNFGSSFGDSIQHLSIYTKLTYTETLKFLGDLVKPDKVQKALNQSSGPIGVSYVSSILWNRGGVSAILWIMALISISLAIMNLLPIPALDGGRIVLVIFNKVFGDKTKKFEAFLVGATYTVLLCFMIYIMFKDTFQIITNTFGQ
jgi:regulator of sigma E protease